LEFNEKLQELRKQKGLTQEQLAERLYVSRTAISKWESGRGFPNIESLKAIARFFKVSLDELLSGEEILEIAEADQKEREGTVRDLIFGLLDCGMSLLLFLPFFGQRIAGVLQEVSLLGLTELQPYLKTAYCILVALMILLGLLTLALQKLRPGFFDKRKITLSLVLSILSVGIFIISQQPYAAIYTFGFLMIKAVILLKRR
jgi:transcriptional regulator with XRE-family HTH domain